MMSDVDNVKKLIEDHRQELGGDSQKIADKALRILDAYWSRSSEDLKQVALVSVDGSKSLQTIAMASAAIIIGFIQYGITTKRLDWADWAILILLVSAGFCFISMYVGFLHIGRVMRRAEGKDEKDREKVAWSAADFQGWRTSQSLLGVAALATFGLGMVFWPSDSETGTVEFVGGSALDEVGLCVDNSRWPRLERSEEGIHAIKAFVTRTEAISSESIHRISTLERAISKMLDALQEKEAGKARVVRVRANIREAPDLAALRLGVLEPGTHVMVYNDDGSWSQVCVGSQGRSYIASRLLSEPR